jgi:hypothetical protein
VANRGKERGERFDDMRLDERKEGEKNVKDMANGEGSRGRTGRMQGR